MHRMPDLTLKSIELICSLSFIFAGMMVNGWLWEVFMRHPNFLLGFVSGICFQNTVDKWRKFGALTFAFLISGGLLLGIFQFTLLYFEILNTSPRQLTLEHAGYASGFIVVGGVLLFSTSYDLLANYWPRKK